MPAMEIPYAKAVVFTTGGRRPEPGREGNWINHVACRLPDEPLPADADGNSMLPLAMFTRSFLPWMPPVLDGTEVLAVFISMALFEHLNDDDLSGWFCVREYPEDAELEPCDWTPPGAKPFVLTPEVLYESEPSFDLEREKASYGHKLGGYPTFIQGEVEFEGHDFAFQISSDSKAGLNIVDQGSFYFSKTASPAHGKPAVTFSDTVRG